MTVLAGIVGEAAARFGQRPAIVVDGGPTLTYGELHEASDAVAVSLAAEGLGAGSVVALDHRSDADWVVAYVALSKLGAVASGINPRLSAAERAARARTGSLRTAVLVDGEVAALREASAGHVFSDVPDLDPEAPAVVVFTSGTTGAPKGAVFRNRQLDAIAAIDLGPAPASGAAAARCWRPPSSPTSGSAPSCRGTCAPAPTIHVLARWRAADVLRVIAERAASPTIGGVAAAGGAAAARPRRSTTTTCRPCRTIVVGGGPLARAAGGRGPPALRRRLLDPVLVHRVRRRGHRHRVRRRRRRGAAHRRPAPARGRGRDRRPEAAVGRRGGELRSPAA